MAFSSVPKYCIFIYCTYPVHVKTVWEGKTTMCRGLYHKTVVYLFYPTVANSMAFFKSTYLHYKFKINCQHRKQYMSSI